MFINSAAQLKALLAKAPEFICDAETDGLQVIGPRSRDSAWIVGLLPSGTSSCFYIDCQHPEWPAMLEALEGTPLIGHNLRFDIHAMNARPTVPWRDTMCAQYHLNTTGKKSLDDLFPGEKLPTLPELKGAKGKQNNIGALRYGLNSWDPKLLAYLDDDLLKTDRLHRRFTKLGQYHDLDERVEQVVQRMEDRGVRLHVDRLEALRQRIHPLVKENEAIIRAAGFHGNLQSPMQLAEFLRPQYPQFYKRVWSTKRRQRELKYATDTKTTLDPYFKQTGDPLIGALMMWRSWMKKEKDFCLKLPTFVQPDGLIHGQIKTTRTGTLRFSHADPNNGQMPKQGKTPEEAEVGKEFRRCITGASGYMSGADFDQFELRAIAALSGDERLLQAFADGVDPHAATAADMAGRPINQIKKGDRVRFEAKTVTLGLPNGMKYRRMAVALGCSEDDAMRFIAKHRDAHPRLHEWMEEVNAEAERTRIAVAVDGSVRVYDPTSMINSAVSMKMQGTSALLNRHGVVACDDAGLKPVLSVHDEIAGDVKERGPEYAEVMREAANKAYPHLLGAVDFTADGGHGDTWADI